MRGLSELQGYSSMYVGVGLPDRQGGAKSLGPVPPTPAVACRMELIRDNTGRDN